MPVDRGNPAGDPKYILGSSAPPARDVLRSFFVTQLVTDSRPLGRDVSIFQGDINTDVMAANGVIFLAARAGISWGYTDPNFSANWSKAGATGLYRTSYHVLYTDQPISRQMDHWYASHPALDRMVPRVIDLEVDRGDSYSRKASAWWSACEIIKARDGIYPITYSRRLLVDLWLASVTTERLNLMDWWLAQYLYDRTVEHPGPPTPPSRVDPENVIIHQTADRKPPFPYEVESRTVDWDRFQVDEEWLAVNWGGQDPTIPPIDEGYPRLVLEARARGWNI